MLVIEKGITDEINRYRDKFEILSSILDIANGNEIIGTEILTKANLTHSLFKEHMFLLYQYGLIEIEYMQPKSKRTYSTSTCFFIQSSIRD